MPPASRQTDAVAAGVAETRQRWIATATILLLVLLPVLGGKIFGTGWGHPATSGSQEDPDDADAPETAPATEPIIQDQASTPTTAAEPWRFATAGEVWAHPVPFRDKILVGSDDGTLYALDADTGRVAWTVDSEGAVRTEVALLGDTAFWTSADGFAHAASADDGERRWRRRVAARSGAAAGGGRIFVGTDAGLTALAADTGVPAWNAAVGAVTATPAVADGSVIAGSPSGHVTALDVRTGAVRWTFATGAEITTSPRLAGRLVLVTAGDGTVFALDAVGGGERWRTGTSEFVGSAPAAADGRVFVGGGDGALWAFDAKSGLGRWRRRLAEPVRGTPVPAGDALWMAAGDRYLAAVRAADGEPLHVFAVSGWVSAPPLVTTDGQGVERLVFVTADGAVHGLPLQIVQERLAPPPPQTARPAAREPRLVVEPTFHDGAPALLWRRTLPSPPAAAPALDGGRLFVGAGNALHALDADSGQPSWRADADGAFDATPVVVRGAVRGNRVLAARRAGGDGRGAVHAFDLDDGRELWRADAPDDVTSTPGIWRGRAIFGSAAGTVHAIRIDDGGEIWRHEVAGSVLTSPAVTGDPSFGWVLIGACDGSVHALSADDGRELWRFQAEDCVASDVVVAPYGGQEAAYVADAGGHVYALDPAVGGELWRASLGGGAGRRPRVEGGTVYLGAHDRRIWALSALHGGTTWSFDAGERVTGSLAIDLGVAYAASLDGTLHALGAFNGQEFWRLETGGAAYDVALADGVVYLVASSLPDEPGEEAGAIYALRVP